MVSMRGADIRPMFLLVLTLLLGLEPDLLLVGPLLRDELTQTTTQTADRVLATSREGLAVPGEQVWPLRALVIGRRVSTADRALARRPDDHDDLPPRRPSGGIFGGERGGPEQQARDPEDVLMGEEREQAQHEGMHGISPRYIQDKISNALVAHPDEDNINPFMVLKQLEEGLRHHALIKDEEQIGRAHV